MVSPTILHFDENECIIVRISIMFYDEHRITIIMNISVTIGIKVIIKELSKANFVQHFLTISKFAFDRQILKHQRL